MREFDCLTACCVGLLVCLSPFLPTAESHEGQILLEKKMIDISLLHYFPCIFCVCFDCVLVLCFVIG